MKKLLLLLSVAVLTLTTSCADVCEQNVTCKFQKGDLVQDKTSRAAKKGAVIDFYVTGKCDCRYKVSNTTWIEGKRTRDMSEYELELADEDRNNDGLDLDAMELLKTIF